MRRRLVKRLDAHFFVFLKMPQSSCFERTLSCLNQLGSQRFSLKRSTFVFHVFTRLKKVESNFTTKAACEYKSCELLFVQFLEKLTKLTQKSRPGPKTNQEIFQTLGNFSASTTLDVEPNSLL